MTSFEPIVGGTSAQAQGFELSPDWTDETQPQFAEPQRPPTPPTDPTVANMLLAAALRDGNPQGDDLPRQDGAPTRA